MSNSITILRGQSYVREFTITNSTGSAYNLTGQKVTFQVYVGATPYTRYNTIDHPTKVFVVGAPTLGVVRVSLAPADTNLDERIYDYVLYAEDGTGKITPLVDPTSFYVVEGGLP